MDESVPERRVEELLRSPGGCALLLKAAEADLSPAAIAEPVTALHLAASSIEEIIPWRGDHDWMVDRLLREGPRHRELARALLRERGIARWWAPLDRDGQVWLESELSPSFPGVETFPTPTSPPDRLSIYAQHPHPMVSTSTEVDGWTSRLASFAEHAADSELRVPARRALARVAPNARVREIVSAEDWHSLAVRYGVRSDPGQSFYPRSDRLRGLAWGPNDGLVPDWRAVGREWDGVHVTLWALLTALQVRVASEAGWSEAWSWEAEETIWLRWVFDSVEPLPALKTLPNESHTPLPWRFYARQRPGAAP